MFFIISKLLDFLVTPLNWIILVFAFSFIFRKRPMLQKRLRICGFVMLLFFTNSFVADEALNIWEWKMAKEQQLDSVYEAGIVLGGGMITYDIEYQRNIFRQNTDRMLQALHLYKSGRIKKIIISSGAGSIIYTDIIESRLLKNYLLDIGIPDSAVIIDSVSNNTYENAIFTASIIQQHQLKGKFLLITSAFHMQRAAGCFRKAGINFTPYATNKMLGKRKFYLSHLFVPHHLNLEKWDKFFHEITGYLIYKMMGYL